MKKIIILGLFLLSLTVKINAQSDSVKFILDVPVLDAPANFDNNNLAFKQFSPSMEQSLQWSKSFNETQMYYTQRLFFKPNKKYGLGKKIVRHVGLSFTNFVWQGLTATFPLSGGWAHEEWHRAVMNKNNIRSYNDMNKFPIGAQIVAVSHVRDEDLIRLKKESNRDLVRLASSGMEAQSELVKQMQKDAFFGNSKTQFSIFYLLQTLNNFGYVRTPYDARYDSVSIKMEAAEGKDLEVRDFTGLDNLGWVYDLSRPNEPYEARGKHPSDVGIRRYRRVEDLSAEELGFLKKVGNLQYLNFINPSLFFINSIKINKDTRFNFGLFNNLTSFGYDNGLNLFLEHKNHKIFTTLHHYNNLQKGFYGIETSLIDHPLHLGKSTLNISPTLHVWTQPKDHDFRTSDAQLGGLVGIKIASSNSKWQPYLTLTAKTDGWVAGNVYLEPNESARMGIRLVIR